MTLCNDKHIEICRLSGNACGKIGGLAIAEMIKDNYTIEELSLANTEFVRVQLISSFYPDFKIIL